MFDGNTVIKNGPLSEDLLVAKKVSVDYLAADLAYFVTSFFSLSFTLHASIHLSGVVKDHRLFVLNLMISLRRLLIHPQKVLLLLLLLNQCPSQKLFAANLMVT